MGSKLTYKTTGIITKFNTCSLNCCIMGIQTYRDDSNNIYNILVIPSDKKFNNAKLLDSNEKYQIDKSLMPIISLLAINGSKATFEIEKIEIESENEFKCKITSVEIENNVK